MAIFSTTLAAGVCILLIYHLIKWSNQHRLARSNGCSPPRKYPHKEPLLGLDIFLNLPKLLKEHRLLTVSAQRYTDYGRTYQSKNLGKTQINSIQPENIHAVFSSKSFEWGVQPLRLAAQMPFCGRGIITTDGADWKHARTLLKPAFLKSNISDLGPLEEHLQKILLRIPKDGSTVDLDPLFSDLYLDLATLFLFGESIGALSQTIAPHAEGVLDAFDTAMRGSGIRIMLGPMKFLYRSSKWQRACETIHRFADHYVDIALEHRQKYLVGDHSEKLKTRALIASMAEQTDNREDLRCQIIQAHIGAQETTGNSLGNVFFLLSRHEVVWKKLREEVVAIGDAELTWEYLSKLKYIYMVLSEARLYPVLPQIARIALKTTTLPAGGGPDGKSPIYIQKGDLFSTSSYSLHRDPDIWGPDAADFKPDRWDNNFKPGPGTYIPFGAGPRVCIGQQKALMESAYVVVRMMQEFSGIESRDDREWVGQFRITVKNAHGCLVSLTPSSVI